MKRFALILLAGTAMLGAPHFANATPITASSNFTVDWSLPYNGTTTAAATATFSNFNFVAPNEVQFTMDITNTSSGTVADDVRFTSFGWDTSPATSAVTDTTSVYTSVVNTSLGSDSVSVCFYAGSNCNGGGNGGLEDTNHAGQHGDPTTTGAFTVTVTFGTSSIPPLDFSAFNGKFQGGGNLGSIEGLGTCTGGCTNNPVPEPASMTLFGSALILLGAVGRRKRNSCE